MKRIIITFFIIGLGIFLSFDSYACSPPSIQGPSGITINANQGQIVTYSIDPGSTTGCYVVEWGPFLPIHSEDPSGHWIKYYTDGIGGPKGYVNKTLTANISWLQVGCGDVWDTSNLSMTVLWNVQ